MTQYLESKIDGKTYCKTNGQFSRHLSTHSMDYQAYHEQYITGTKETCSYCTAPKKFYHKDSTYATTCGAPTCRGLAIKQTKSNWSKEERKADSDNKRQSALLVDQDKRKAKVMHTCIERYGVESPAQSEQQKSKSRNTKLERYGNAHYAGWEKSAATNRNKTVEEQNTINDKRRATNLRVHGVENLFMKTGNARKVNKGNSSIKQVTLPSGKVIGVRGYEPHVIDLLLTEYHYKEDELIIHDDNSEYAIEVFTYINMQRKTLKYYPDIYIPAENKIIEVKSRWWYDANGRTDDKYKSRLENNLLKKQSVLDKGYKYELWLFESPNSYTII